MKIKKNLLLGVTASLAFLLTLMSVASAYSLEWEGKINETLGIEGSSTSDEGDTDTQYFKSEFGDGSISEANQALLVEESKKQCYNEVAEGATLLRNRHNALPLAQTERKISIFGNNALSFEVGVSIISPNSLFNFTNSSKLLISIIQLSHISFLSGILV